VLFPGFKLALVYLSFFARSSDFGSTSFDIFRLTNSKVRLNQIFKEPVAVSLVCSLVCYVLKQIVAFNGSFFVEIEY